MGNKNRYMLQFVAFSIVVVIALTIGLVAYYDSLFRNLQDNTASIMNEIMKQEKHNFVEKVTSDKEVIEGYAKLINYTYYDQDKLKNKLETISESTDFASVIFATTDGEAIDNKGKHLNISQCEYFLDTMKGKTVISEPVKSKNINIITVAAPVKQEDKITGALVGTLCTNKLDEVIIDSFGGYGYTYITTNAGEIIAKSKSPYVLSKSGNLFDVLEEAKFYGEGSCKKIKKNLIDEKSGNAQYSFKGASRHMHYEKLPINGWNIFMVTNTKRSQEVAGKILANAFLLIGGLVITFIALLLYNLYSQKRFTRELTQMAFVDDVTGFMSFGKFKVEATEILRRYRDKNFMFVKMDIENFRIINQVYSMSTGDKVLKAIAEALSVALDDKTDAFARIHADEFVILFAYEDEGEWLGKKEKFDSLFFQKCESLIEIKPVMPQGRYRLQKGETNLAAIYEKANFALRIAKSSNVKELFFEGHIEEQAIYRKDIECKMENALKQGEFKLLLQPKYRLNDSKMVGAKVLVRWETENEPTIYSKEFIPIFEENGFITKIDLYIFENACKILRRWIEGGIEPIELTINFSCLSLCNPSFVSEVCKLVDAYEIPHKLLKIEMTETTVLGKKSIGLKEGVEKLREFRREIETGDYVAVPMLPEQLEIKLVRGSFEM